MIYLKSFSLPTFFDEEYNNDTPHAYPYGIFPFKEFEYMDFEPVTIFYGGNGSGKSTLLNLISEKLELPRSTPFNTSPLFSKYVGTKCSYSLADDDEGLPVSIPFGSKIITSEDVFNNILTVRNDNLRIDKLKTEREKDYYQAKYDKISFRGLDDYETLKKQNTARKQTVTEFVTDRAGKNIKMNSNGETSLLYFDKHFESDRLYLLDEPENSLSLKFQLKLVELIIQCSYYCNCQFVIASHSPFILSIPGAKIYDLDSVPVIARKWYELENMQLYNEFFMKNNKFFTEFK